jgi:hypothetical protein
MGKLPGINIKALLIGLVSNAIPHFTTKHHLITSHEIKHHVIKLGHKCFLVNEIEVDHVICGYLNTNISLDEVDVASGVDCLVVGPFSIA